MNDFKKYFLKINYIIGLLLIFNMSQNVYAQENTSESFVSNQNLIDTAKNYLGIKYQYSGKKPETGFDCSGFTRYVYGKFNYELPHTSSSYNNVGKKVKKQDALPGDIILFNNRRNSKIGHVGIVVENSLDELLFIHASTSRGVVISKLSTPYYQQRFVEIRRVLP